MDLMFRADGPCKDRFCRARTFGASIWGWCIISLGSWGPNGSSFILQAKVPGPSFRSNFQQVMVFHFIAQFLEALLNIGCLCRSLWF